MVSFAQRRFTEVDSIRCFLEGIGEQEVYIKKIIEDYPNMSYKDIFDAYLQGFRLNNIDSEWRWSFGPRYFDMNNSYLYEKIIQDTIVSLLHPLYMNSFSKNDKDSVLYCCLYAINHFNSQSAAAYYEDIHKRKYQNNPSLDNQCALLYAMMVYYVLIGGAQHFTTHDINLVPCDTLWVAENKKRRLENGNDSVDPYNLYYDIVILPAFEQSLLLLTPKDKENILGILDRGIQLGSRSCAITKAFALITGVVLDQNISEGKELLVRLWPMMQDSYFWEYLDSHINMLKN